MFFSGHPVHFQTGIRILWPSEAPGLSVSRQWVTNVSSSCFMC